MLNRLQTRDDTSEPSAHEPYCQLVYASGTTMTAAAHHHAALRHAITTNAPTFEGVDEYDCPILLRLDDAIGLRLVTAEYQQRMDDEDRERDLGFR